MILVSIRRESDDSLLFDRVLITQTAWERMRGLLGRARLASNEALLIKPCSSVHMFGMRYALDIAYLNNLGEVIKIVSSLRPMSMSACFTASSVLEMPENALYKNDIKVGDRLIWEERE